MSADQTPTGNVPAGSRVDVAGLRAAAEAATNPPRCTCSWQGGAAYSSGCARHDPQVEGYLPPFRPDPTTVLALLDERDDLAARLATAEAENEWLRRWKRGTELLRWPEEAHRQQQRASEWRRRAEKAERQVQAVRDLVDAVGKGWVMMATVSDRAELVRELRAALAPLDPDAPTGHDGHGDQPEGGA